MAKLTALLGLLLVLSAAVAQEFFGSWVVFSRFDRITDENTSYMAASVLEKPSQIGDPLLFVRCADWSDGVEVFLSAPRYLVVDEFIDVVYRVDQLPPVHGQWLGLVTGQAVLVPQDIPGFFSQTMSGAEVAIRVSGPLGNPTFVFAISGFPSALRALGCYTGPVL